MRVNISYQPEADVGSKKAVGWAALIAVPAGSTLLGLYAVGYHRGRAEGNKLAEEAVARGCKMGVTLTDIQMVAKLALPASGTTGANYTFPTGPGAALHPELYRWLMGFPAGWSAYAPTATPSSRRSPPSSSGPSSRPAKT